MWTRRIRWPRITGCCAVVAFMAAAPARAEQSEHADGEVRTGAASSSRSGFELHLRVSGDYSRVKYGREDFASYEAEGTATTLPLDEPSLRTAWGGRLEAGVAVVRSRGFAVVPRGSWAIARLKRQQERVAVVGIEHSWNSSPLWWSLASGAELQLIRRILCLSLELGFAGVHERVTEARPEGLQFTLNERWGLHSRASAGVRLPLTDSFVAGPVTSAEVYVGLLSATRTAFGLFVEWQPPLGRKGERP